MWFLAVLAFFTGSVVSPVAAANRDVTQFFNFGSRPAGLYRLVLAKDITLCDAIVRSLNKPFQSGPTIFAHSRNPASIILLTSDLQVAWQRRIVGGQSEGEIDFAEADLRNNGYPLAVYRWPAAEDGRGVDVLFLLRSPVEAWPSEEVVSDSLLREIYKKSLKSDLVHDIDLLLWDKVHLGSLSFNVLHVDDKFILLALGADEASAAIDNGRSFHVFAILYNANLQPSLVCELRGAA